MAVSNKRNTADSLNFTGDIGHVRDQAVLDILRPMALAAALLLATHAVYYFTRSYWSQVWIDGLSAVLFLVVWALLAKFSPPRRYVHLSMSLFGVTILINVLHTFYDPSGATLMGEIYMAIVVLSTGVVMTSVRHFSVFTAMTAVAWVVVSLHHADLHLISEKLLHLLVMIYLSILIFWSRLKTYGRLEEELKERRSTATALKRSELRYRDVINAQGEGMVILNPVGRIVFCNPALEDIFGEPPNQLQGRLLKALMSLEAWKTFSANTKTCESGKRTRFELDLVKDDQDKKHLLVTATPMCDDDGNTDGLLGLFRDITHRKQSELKQRKLIEQIQQVQKLESLGVLAGGIAHEFNNILMGVMGNADIVKQDAVLKGESRECIAEIAAASRRATALCRQMLGYSGKGKFIVDRLDLSDVIRGMAHLLEIPTTKRANIRYELSEVLPAMEADITQIGQVVINLVTNASEAIDETEGEIVITTDVTHLDQTYIPQAFLPVSLKPGPYVSLEVTDNGCGMDKTTKERIFDPFFSTKFVGRGLGLAAVLGIVRGHNGTVEVYSEKGKGSSIRILFPAVDQPANTRSEPPVENAAWVGRGMVLLVDDEPTVLKVGVRMLKQMGFSVITATDGVEAVETFKNRHKDIDVIILDQTMPRMNGASAFRQMREIDPEALVILSSGYNEKEIATELVPYGLVGFLPKPYDIRILRSRLQAVFEGRRAFESVPPETGGAAQLDAQ